MMATRSPRISASSMWCVDRMMVRPGRDTDIKRTHVQRSWVWEKPSKFSSERAFLKLIWMGRGAFEVQVHWKTARSIYRHFYISLCIEKFPVLCIRRSSRWSQTPAGLSAGIISALPVWRGSGSSRRLSFDLPRAEISWNIMHLRFPKADVEPGRETRVYIERCWCWTL